MIPHSVEDRFWAKVQKGPDCWEWAAALTGPGYGLMSVGEGRLELAHRISWQLHFGPIALGMCICHHCDNRKCVRPDHLFTGTKKDNNLDMRKKKRQRGFIVPGQEHGGAKLTEGDVTRMRAEYQIGVGRGSHAAAEAFGISQSAAYRILKGQRWGHV